MKLNDILEEVGEGGDERTAWFAKYSNIKYHSPHSIIVNEDGSRSITSSLPFIISGNCTELAPIRVVHAEFKIVDTKITSLRGCPEKVHSHVVIQDNDELISLEGAPKYIAANLQLFNLRLTSLHNIHRHFEHIGGNIQISNNVSSHLLGLILIKGVTRVEAVSWFNVPSKMGQQTYDAVDIINKHLGKGRAGVLAAQQELLDAGLDEYAKL